ncbi:MAG: hypothetical protein ACOYNP_06430 [Gemmataceae bacterium]
MAGLAGGVAGGTLVGIGADCLEQQALYRALAQPAWVHSGLNWLVLYRGQQV